MSKSTDKAKVQAISLAVALRRKIVDCRFSHQRETSLLEQSRQMIDNLEAEKVNERIDGKIAEAEKAVADGD